VSRLLLLLALGCADGPPIDGEGDPDISACCDWYARPWLDDPQECLHDNVDIGKLTNGQCWRLDCLGGLVSYLECNCDGELEPDGCP
jgi:hypothetical protein